MTRFTQAVGEMLDTHFWSRNNLPPQEIIEVASLFLTFAQSINNLHALHLLCGNVSTVLYSMKHGPKKCQDPSPENQELCEKVASLFIEHGKLWGRLDNAEKAKSSVKKAEKWR